MPHLRYGLLVFTVVFLTGCYHTRIETGLAPGTQVIDQEWAPSFVYGLVPPPTVEAGEECPNGVAIVETEISFLNGLVSALTFSIFTPMHIKVTCAAGTSALSDDTESIQVSSGATTEEVVEAFGRAADRAVVTQESVLVRFE